jgi:hypothetical protein
VARARGRRVSDAGVPGWLGGVLTRKPHAESLEFIEQPGFRPLELTAPAASPCTGLLGAVSDRVKRPPVVVA